MAEPGPVMDADISGAPAPSESLPVGAPEIFAAAAMLALFLVAQALAVLMTPSFEAAGVEAFEDPEDWTNGLVLIGVILVFTALILWIARKRQQRIIQWIILASVGITIAYVFYALMFNVNTRLDLDALRSVWGWYALVVLALALATIPTWLLYKFPEWYVVDLVGVLVSAGAVAIFGTSFTPATYTLVLAGTAIYDAISVYKTKHMLDLADSVLELHLPIMLVVPKSRHYSFLDEQGGLGPQSQKAKAAAQDAAPPAPMAGDPAPVPQEGEPVAAEGAKKERSVRDAMFLGLGDIVIPSILVVSALTFTGAASAIGAFLGIAAGYLFLMAFVLRGKPQAGLPALNGGAFLGFVGGFWLEHGSLVFW